MSLRMHDESAEIPQCACPYCGNPMNRISQVAVKGGLAIDAPKGKPGDLTVCIRCGGMLKFGVKMDLQPLSAEDFIALSDDERRLLSAARRAAVSIPRDLRGVH
jgi:hypothetical protein